MPKPWRIELGGPNARPCARARAQTSQRAPLILHVLLHLLDANAIQDVHPVAFIPTRILHSRIEGNAGEAVRPKRGSSRGEAKTPPSLARTSHSPSAPHAASHWRHAPRGRDGDGSPGEEEAG